ncbi:MAG: betaine/proline/choline family ABC transporter ATP-binding protein [Actinobacteria bacterium]|nr:betaine/proline/choline family ABC transporter ATP-binding protein [Actinomycetota bacterium]
MITFDSVTKRFPDGTTAVNELSLEVPEGQVAVFVGPSGCGKTTSLRMINRMIEPTDGTIVVDGENALAVDPPQLRRRIGYVIQQIGLFPHRTIAENIATVPGLVNWDKERTKQRVNELIDVVGLPSDVANRYPHQLSGGQQQRVGVARALAVDPPIMLMDEPFGAVDPIVRTRLQDEFLRLQRDVRKTIVFVTHDIDEAIKMGDKVAILSEGGHLQQYASPEEILRAPANDFVADFLGGERGLKRLALIPVSEITALEGPLVGPDDEPSKATQAARDNNTDWVVVVEDRKLRGWVSVDDLDGRQRVGEVQPRDFSAKIQASDSLRAALNAMVTSLTGVAARVGDDDVYEGLLTQELLARELQDNDPGPGTMTGGEVNEGSTV